jgi:hypothetical protein
VPVGGLRGKRSEKNCDSCVLIWEFFHRFSSSEPHISQNSVKGTANPAILRQPIDTEKKQ